MHVKGLLRWQFSSFNIGSSIETLLYSSQSRTTPIQSANQTLRKFVLSQTQPLLVHRIYSQVSALHRPSDTDVIVLILLRRQNRFDTCIQKLTIKSSSAGTMQRHYENFFVTILQLSVERIGGTVWSTVEY